MDKEKERQAVKQISSERNDKGTGEEGVTVGHRPSLPTLLFRRSIDLALQMALLTYRL